MKHSISVQGEGYSYSLTSVTQQFVLDSTENENLTTKLLAFECNNKLEGFSLFYSHWHIGELRFGNFKLLFQRTVYAMIN